MGYTHYWSFKPVKRGQTKSVNAAYSKAVKDCQKIVLYWQSIADSDSRLSGYSAHTKIGAYLGLNINGKGELAHETFVLRDYFKANNSGGFCKTAQKPYDTVVVACLAVLKHYLGDMIDVSSDGRAHEWIAGVALANLVLKRLIANPISGRPLLCPDGFVSMFKRVK